MPEVLEVPIATVVSSRWTTPEQAPLMVRLTTLVIILVPLLCVLANRYISE